MPGCRASSSCRSTRTAGLTTSLQERAEKAGLRGLVLTVDAPNYGIRPADKRAPHAAAEEIRIANLDGRNELPNRPPART